ncbi:MFS transporter [Thermobifida alba]|uniref:MFS transporter n=1 Tax=Thermobifida alba TaxID=53522 RepID=A0ABY4L6P2_THEAE|nr:MFS transporter [Thermobifida alba]UPT22148.1 MFS transporter [Thermobifida alba]
MPEAVPVPSRRPRLLVAALACGGVLTAAVQTVTVPLLPHLPDLVDSTPETVSWAVTATLVVGAVATPVLGRLGDLYGKRRMLLSALAILVAGCLLCALSSHVLALVAGRALQGAAVAVVPLGISVLRDVLPPERVAAAVGLMSATVGIGATVGVPLSALVAQYADWHAVFWGCGALGLLCAVLVSASVPRAEARTGGRLDLLGTLGLTVVLVCLLLAVTQGTTWGWTSPAVLGLFAVSLAVGAVWARHETRVADPIVELRVMASPAVLLTNLATLLLGFTTLANSLATSQLVQEPPETGYGLGLSVFAGSLTLLPAGITMLVFSPVAAWLSTALGPRSTTVLGALVIAVGFLVRLFTSESLAMIVAGATVVGIGGAVSYAALPTLLMRHVPRGRTGAANGVNFLLRAAGQAVCSAVVATVLAGVTVDAGGVTAPAFEAYLLVFALSGVLALAGAAAVQCVPERSRPAP